VQNQLLRKCDCSGNAILCEPNYADDSDTMVVCEDCDTHTEGFVFGEHREGSTLAIAAWNNREVYPYVPS
jgi:hypothetical protein